MNTDLIILLLGCVFIFNYHRIRKLWVRHHYKAIVYSIKRGERKIVFIADYFDIESDARNAAQIAMKALDENFPELAFTFEVKEVKN